MKLNEAILLGSIGSEQGFGPDSMATKSPTKCAMGGALFARGVDATFDNGLDMITKLYPWLLNQVLPPVTLPDTSHGRIIDKPICIHGVIWRLNDILKWTRPQIAAWVATQEAIYDVQPVEQPITEEVCLEVH